MNRRRQRSKCVVKLVELAIVELGLVLLGEKLVSTSTGADLLDEDRRPVELL